MRLHLLFFFVFAAPLLTSVLTSENTAAPEVRDATAAADTKSIPTKPAPGIPRSAVSPPALIPPKSAAHETPASNVLILL